MHINIGQKNIKKQTIQLLVRYGTVKRVKSYMNIKSLRGSIHRVGELAEHKFQNNKENQYEFIKQTILTSESLTSNENSYAIKLINKKIDKSKVRTRRICEDCQKNIFSCIII
jgi:hypothetical protein